MASFDELNRILNNSSAQAGSPNRGGSGNPGGVHNTSPGRPSPAPNNDYLAQLDQMYQNYYNYYNGQNPALGRYRPPTMGGNGSDPNNWNDYGGYAYNLPTNFGPAATSWTQRDPSRNRAAEARNMNPTGPSLAEVNAQRAAAGLAALSGYEFSTGQPYSTRGAGARSGTPYRGPAETHVGGPYGGDKPGTVNGGTKGPAQVADQLAALEDWEFRQRGRFNNRWGRY